MSHLDYKGVSGARPASSTAPVKGQGGHEAQNGLDYRGEPDSRPRSNTNDCDSVNVGSGEAAKKTGGLEGL